MIAVAVRTLLYFWVAVEFLSLAQLYHAGYKNHRQTKVILSLQRLLFFVGATYGALTLMPLVGLFDSAFANAVRNVLIVFTLPVLYYIRDFRRWSLSESEMGLPNKK